MPSTRRRVLLGAAGTLTALAGCNETTSDDYPTVTPVDVPRSSSEILREAAEIEWPTLPPAVPISEERLDRTLAHAESLVSDLRAATEANPDVDLTGLRRAIPNDPNDIIKDANANLQSARETDRAEAALRRIESTVRDVALALGYIEAETGAVDRAAVEAMIEDEQAAVDALTEGFSYRIVRPLEAHLPMFYEAERRLTEHRHLDRAREQLANTDDGGLDEHTAFALARENIEHSRLARSTIATLHDSATDADAPSLRAAIPPVLADLREEVEAIAESYADRDPASGSSPKSRVRNIRIHVGGRSRRWLSELDENDGEPSVRLLVDIATYLTEFDALDAAVTRTVDRFENGEIPAESVIEAKEDAVEGMETVVDGTALQRHFAERSEVLLESADRIARREGDERSVARAHLFYAGVAEWTARAVERGADLTASLEAKQS
jgi:hypothetical protein